MRVRSGAAAAREHEGDFEYDYHRPIIQWTGEDIGFVVDMVRDEMPREAPDGQPVYVHFADLADPYGQDGRALNCVFFGLGPDYVGRGSASPKRRQHLWFSTAAGYSARVYLPMSPPPAAIIPLACSSGIAFNVRIDLDRRAVRRWAGGAR
jgi:hypothetical protein